MTVILERRLDINHPRKTWLCWCSQDAPGGFSKCPTSSLFTVSLYPMPLAQFPSQAIQCPFVYTWNPSSLLVRPRRYFALLDQVIEITRMIGISETSFYVNLNFRTKEHVRQRFFRPSLELQHGMLLTCCPRMVTFISNLAKRINTM